MAVKRQRTVKAKCVKAQVCERVAGHCVEHRDGQHKIICSVTIGTTVTRSLPQSMRDKICNSNTTGTCLADAA